MDLTPTTVGRLCAETGGSPNTVRAWWRGEPVAALTAYAMRAACRELGILYPVRGSAEPAVAVPPSLVASADNHATVTISREARGVAPEVYVDPACRYDTITLRAAKAVTP